MSSTLCQADLESHVNALVAAASSVTGRATDADDSDETTDRTHTGEATVGDGSDTERRTSPSIRCAKSAGERAGRRRPQWCTT